MSIEAFYDANVYFISYVEDKIVWVKKKTEIKIGGWWLYKSNEVVSLG